MGIFDRFTKPAPAIVRDRWNGYTYLFGEDERCVVSFDVTACDPAAQRPSRGYRVIGFSPQGHVGPTGMPSKESFERLKAIEDALVKRLTDKRVACWLVGRQIYRGFRELIFQVEDTAGFEAAYKAVEAQFGGMDLVEKEGWTFFNEKIAPGERGHNHIGNREVIAALEKAGSQLSELHDLEHTFVGPKDALDAVARATAERGFRETGRTDKSITLTNAAALDDQDLIDAMTMWLRRVARESGADYDGWGTAVRRPS